MAYLVNLIYETGPALLVITKVQVEFFVGPNWWQETKTVDIMEAEFQREIEFPLGDL